MRPRRSALPLRLGSASAAPYLSDHTGPDQSAGVDLLAVLSLAG